VRNPREVLLRNHEYRMSYSGCDDSFEDYFSHIDYFLNFNGEKKIFFYEDMIQDKKSFMYELYIFLGNGKKSKLDYIINNIELL